MREPAVDAIARDVECFYRDYMAAFNARDLHAIRERFLGMPYAEYAPDGCLSIHDDRALGVQFEATFERLDRAGWSHSDIDDVNVAPLSENVAVLTSTVTHHHRDGGAVGPPARVMYLAGRTDAGWRIAGYSYLAPGFPGVVAAT